MNKHEENQEWEAMKTQTLHEHAQNERAKSGPPPIDDAVTGELEALSHDFSRDTEYLIGFGLSVLIVCGLFMTLLVVLFFGGCATVAAGGPWPTTEKGDRVVVREREVPGTEYLGNSRISVATLNVVNPTDETRRALIECPLSTYSSDDFRPHERAQWFVLPPHTEIVGSTYIEGVFYGRGQCFVAVDIVGAMEVKR